MESESMFKQEIAPFVIRHYTDDERPTIKGNGFDGLEIGEDRQEAEEFINWVNTKIFEEKQRGEESIIEDETKNPWKAAVIDYLVCAFLLNEENSKDPKKALHDIVSWETQLALDPRVSERAHKLLQMRPEDYTDH